MLNALKKYVKQTPLAIPLIILKKAFSKIAGSQSNEAQIIDRLVSRFNVPKSFVEFGFSGWEFNCITIADEWEGLLIDGDAYNATIARTLFPKAITAMQMWLTLDSLDFVLNYSKSRKLGILSIDVDGNDYWFLEKLIETNPAIIIVEFNVSFGLRPISVPYDSAFDRTKKHESWEYYGASLSAMHHLCRLHGYSLIEVSQNGVNAFFVRSDMLSGSERGLTPEEGYRKKSYPNGATAPTAEFWEAIKHLPYVDVTRSDASFKAAGAQIKWGDS
jgi:hypothetical protein